MSVYETDIPGVGRKFELEIAGDARVIVIQHHDGRCELFHRADADADGEKLLDLSGDQAGKLGSILEGAYFETVDVEALSVPLGDEIIEWTEIPEGSPLDGRSLGDADIRRETGVTVIAVQRGEDTITNPEASIRLRAGDLLVTIGSREEHAAASSLVTPGE